MHSCSRYSDVAANTSERYVQCASRRGALASRTRQKPHQRRQRRCDATQRPAADMLQLGFLKQRKPAAKPVKLNAATTGIRRSLADERVYLLAMNI